MKKLGLLIIIANAFFVSSNVNADDNWLVRVRAVNVAPQNSSSPVAGVTVSSKTIPEVDFSYFFTQNISAELVLTYPQQHNVALNGTNLGTVDELPPTLLAQYHFLPGSSFNPYVGAGINYTLFSSASLAIPGSPATPLSVKNSSVGGAIQIGVDVPIDNKLSFNFDVKKVYMKTDVSASTGYVTTAHIDPILVGVGLGWKF
jgi:outer membrane protein